MLRIATRGSALARWQAVHVAALLMTADPSTSTELVVVETTGDRRAEVPIDAMGGKGVFVKEVQAAVLAGEADLAAHSAKDLPSTTPEGLVLAAVPERGDPCDALVGCSLADLPRGAVVATGSVRRRAQLAHLRPDLQFAPLRGNMQTRLEKAEGFDAIVVAAVALQRLRTADRIAEVLPVDVMVPQVGQGALAVECRATDSALLDLLAATEHGESRRRVDAERAFLAELGGDCDVPAGAHAVVEGDGSLLIDGVVASVDGTRLLRRQLTGHDAAGLGASLARLLLTEGGARLIHAR